MSSADQATFYVREMTRRESRGNGDTQNALRRICKNYRLSFWAAEHIRRGKAKTVNGDLSRKIRGAYVKFCEQEIKKLQSEVAIEKAIDNDDDLENLALQIEALAAQVKAQKARHSG
jgi:predicted RNA-binding protein YlxR (DUF448 family)